MIHLGRTGGRREPWKPSSAPSPQEWVLFAPGAPWPDPALPMALRVGNCCQRSERSRIPFIFRQISLCAIPAPERGDNIFPADASGLGDGSLLFRDCAFPGLPHPAPRLGIAGPSVCFAPAPAPGCAAGMGTGIAGIVGSWQGSFVLGIGSKPAGGSRLRWGLWEAGMGEHSQGQSPGASRDEAVPLAP